MREIWLTLGRTRLSDFTSAMGEVWLTLSAEAQFILEGREEAQQTEKNCLIFSCLASKCEFLFY